VVEGLSSNEFMELYAPFGYEQAISRDEQSFSYCTQAGESLRIIMLDANCYGIGFLKDGTLAWLEEELKQAQQDGQQIITVSHQNLYAHSPLLSFGYQLYNAGKLLPLLEEYGVRCHLSGHMHIQSIMEGAVTEIATESLCVSPVQYGWIELRGSQLSYSTRQTEVSKWSEEQGMDDPQLLDFEAYADSFFRQLGESQITEALAGSGLSEEEIQLMAEAYNEVNSAYFAGRAPDTEAVGSGLSLWEKQEGSFVSRYIDTMLSSPSSLSQITIDLSAP